MKTYEERTEDILKKRDEHNAKMTVLRRRLIPVIAIVVVMATLSAGLFIAFRQNDAPVNEDPVPTGETGYKDGVIGENKSPYNGSGLPEAGKGADNSKMRKTEYPGACAGMRNPAAKGSLPFAEAQVLVTNIGRTTAQCTMPVLFVCLKRNVE